MQLWIGPPPLREEPPIGRDTPGVRHSGDILRQLVLSTWPSAFEAQHHACCSTIGLADFGPVSCAHRLEKAHHLHFEIMAARQHWCWLNRAHHGRRHGLPGKPLLSTHALATIQDGELERRARIHAIQADQVAGRGLWWSVVHQSSEKAGESHLGSRNVQTISFVHLGEDHLAGGLLPLLPGGFSAEVILLQGLQVESWHSLHLQKIRVNSMLCLALSYRTRSS
mmetsp:Transcript_3181/g.7331  ORF Transcript_3181/g.7331 Transcript_3181/m.7331 type:complete len:224 (-) Transcript_3181:225-896(-)